MGSDFIVRPLGIATAAPPLIADQAKPAVGAIDLSAENTTAAITEDVPQRRADNLEQDTLSHQVIVDRDADAIVYRVVDKLTDAVIRQFPDEAVLRSRAYSHTLELLSEQRMRNRAADRRA